MNRSRVIATAALLAVLGAILPFGLLGYLAWERTLSQEQASLNAYAARAVTNVRMVMDQGRAVLATMQTWQGVPCSPEHVARMRQVSFNTRNIEEIDYFDDGSLQCTSWGMNTVPFLAPPADAVLADGIELTLHALPQVTQGDPVTILRQGAYSVLISTSRLSDVIIDDRVQLGVYFDGRLVSDLRSPDAQLMAQLEQRSAERSDRVLSAVARENGWSVVVIRPVSSLNTSLLQELMGLLPVGLAIAALICLLVVRLMRKRLSPLAELGIAVRQKEFEVHYQPIIDLRSGACVGAEALVRWRRPDGELMRPDLFIPLAEESGLILAITDQVIEATLRELGALLRADRSLHVAINLCADDVRTGRFIPVLQRSVQNAGVEPGQIWLEVTERGFMDVEAASQSLDAVRQLGFGVAIDDFGTGYSSLQYLQRLPVDTLKIDKSFVDTVGSASQNSAVLAHIIAMANTLGLTMVAEGVETLAQADALRDQGVQYAQGWLYAKAMPAAAYVSFVQNDAATKATRCRIERGQT